MFNDPLIVVDAHGLTHMHNEIAEQKLLIKQLGEAASAAWESFEHKDYNTYYKLKEALFAYQKYLGIEPDLAGLHMSERNPFTDEITIEGVVYRCDSFRNASVGKKIEKDDHNE